MKFLKYFESVIDKLVIELDEEEYRKWQTRIIGAPTNDVVPIIESQIDIIEKHFGKEFDRELVDYWQSKSIGGGRGYEYHRKYGLIQQSVQKSDLYLSIAETDDCWYLVEVYSEWYYHWFLCDDIVGLRELGENVIKVLQKNDLPVD